MCALRTGLPELRSTQVYPPAFGKAVAKLFTDHRAQHQHKDYIYCSSIRRISGTAQPQPDHNLQSQEPAGPRLDLAQISAACSQLAAGLPWMNCQGGSLPITSRLKQLRISQMIGRVGVSKSFGLS